MAETCFAGKMVRRRGDYDMAARAQAASTQAAEPKGWKPSISDEKVKAATGRGWMGWFIVLNKANAGAVPHKQIAQLLYDKGCPGWWAQMITVEYERARSGRQKHEKADGYSVSITKVLPVDLPVLFAAATDPKLRGSWFPKGAFEETSKTENKYWRGKWKKDARLEVGFYAKGAGKSQIALQVNKLSDAAAVEKDRAAWKKAFEKLSVLLSEVV
jgi:hypothetical protein